MSDNHPATGICPGTLLPAPSSFPDALAAKLGRGMVTNSMSHQFPVPPDSQRAPWRFGIVASEYNREYVDGLVGFAKDEVRWSVKGALPVRRSCGNAGTKEEKWHAMLSAAVE